MNGYIQITINGEHVGLKFGFLALKEFLIAAEKKKDVFYHGENISFLGIAKLIQCGYKNNCEIKEVEPLLTLEDFNSWTEEAMNSEERERELAEVLNVFAQSQYVKTLQDLPKEEAKKKIPKSTLKKSKAKSSPKE